MTFLTSDELTAMRADVLETLFDTCNILRPTTSVDSHYFADESSAGTVGTAVACRLDPYTNRNDSSGMVADREANRAYFMLTLPWNATIDDGDRVVFGSDTLQVLQLYNVHSDRLVTRVLCAKVAGG
jgi:hypothetical protein